MDKHTKKILEKLAFADLRGSELRVALFIASKSRQIRLSEIEEALNLHKTNASRICNKLYRDGILKKFVIRSEKHAIPLYSFNYQF